MAKGTWVRSRGRRLALVLAGAAVAGAGCGGEDRLSRDDFRDRLGSIATRESGQFGRLAQRAATVKDTQPLPDDFKQAMEEVAEGNRRAAEELEQLEVPEDAQAATEELIRALRERAAGFERAAGKERVTMLELEEDGSITRAGNSIDRARERLRRQGFLPADGDHSEE